MKQRGHVDLRITYGFLLLFILFSAILIMYGPDLTGLVVYQEIEDETSNQSRQEMLAIFESSDYSYDSSINNMNELFSLTNTTSTSIVTSIENNEVVKAEYDDKDKTDKVISLDNKKLEINDNKLLKITFSESLDNGDVISLYINEGQESTLMLCEDEACETFYGQTTYLSEGPYNISIIDLGNPTAELLLHSSENIKINYITSYHFEVSELIETNVISNGTLLTTIISPDNLNSWINYSSEEELNGQNIEYFYSTDNGNIWTELVNNDLRGISSEQLQLKINLYSNGNISPRLKNIKIYYFATQCSEEWVGEFGQCSPNNTKLKYYNDENSCKTTITLPEDNNTLVSCNYCLLNTCNNSFIANVGNSLTIIEEENIRLEIQPLSSNQEPGDGSASNNTITIIEYYFNPLNNSAENTGLKFVDITTEVKIDPSTLILKYTDEELTSENLTEDSLYIGYFNKSANDWDRLESTVNTSSNYVSSQIPHFSLYGLFGEEDQGSNNNNSNNSNNGNLTENNFSESNNSSNDTIILPPSDSGSTVTPGSSSGGGGGGSSGGSQKEAREAVKKNNSTISFNTLTETETTKNEGPIAANLLLKESSPACNYSTIIDLPESISLISDNSFSTKIINTGDCELKEINITLSPELEQIIEINPKSISSINITQEIPLQLVVRQKIGEKIISPITGLAAFSPLISQPTEGRIRINSPGYEEEINIRLETVSEYKIKKGIFVAIPNILSIITIFITITLMLLRKKNSKEKNEQEEDNIKE